MKIITIILVVTVGIPVLITLFNVLIVSAATVVGLVTGIIQAIVNGVKRLF